jgi:predicted HAD superfamily Cof-like phosphohydrolase
MSNFNKVGTFMKTFGQEVKIEPSFSTEKINKLRIDLIKEELQELNGGYE